MSTGYTTSVVVVDGKTTTSVLVTGPGETTSLRATVSPTASLQGSGAGRSVGHFRGVLLVAALGLALVFQE